MWKVNLFCDYEMQGFFFSSLIFVLFCALFLCITTSLFFLHLSSLSSLLFCVIIMLHFCIGGGLLLIHCIVALVHHYSLGYNLQFFLHIVVGFVCPIALLLGYCYYFNFRYHVWPCNYWVCHCCSISVPFVWLIFIPHLLVWVVAMECGIQLISFINL